MSGTRRLRRVLNIMNGVNPVENRSPAVTEGIEEYRVVLPPVVDSVNVLGQLTDGTGVACLQTNGRSSVIAGRPYFNLNNTMDNTVMDDSADDIANMPQNSVTAIAEPGNDPLTTLIATKHRKSRSFMSLTPNEVIFEHEGGYQLLLSVQGGMCTPDEKSNKAFVWIQKWRCEACPDDNNKVVEIYEGTGVGLVEANPSTGEIEGRRLTEDRVLFDQNEPSYGSFCAAQDGKWFYTFRKKGEHVYLARVGTESAHSVVMYEFWDGYKFSGYETAIAPVFSGYSHGTIFRTKMFGKGYSWVFIGLNERGERTVDIGLAPDIWGPYKMSELLTKKNATARSGDTRLLLCPPMGFRRKTWPAHGHLE